MSKACVLGVGNRHMTDDAIGVRVAESLADPASAFGVPVVDGGVRGMGLLKHFTDAEFLVYIDAIDAGAEPGAVFRFDPDAAGVTSLRSNTLHGTGLPYLLTSARMLGHAPEVVVYAVQVGDVRPGDELTPAVERAAGKVRELVLEELAARVSALEAASDRDGE